MPPSLLPEVTSGKYVHGGGGACFCCCQKVSCRMHLDIEVNKRFSIECLDFRSVNKIKKHLFEFTRSKKGYCSILGV